MARYVGPKCRLCRREGIKLFLKGNRCFTAKCAIEVRNYPPGMHQARKLTEYGEQLREKQKLRRMYGLMEQQFRNYYRKAVEKKGVTGEQMLQMIETRIDNVAYLLGFAPSRDAARQLVRHGHLAVNGRKINIPSFNVKAGDKINVAPRDKSKKMVTEAFKVTESRPVPGWLSIDRKTLKAEVVKMPIRQDIQVPVDENMIVELYSK